MTEVSLYDSMLVSQFLIGGFKLIDQIILV
jgi:hypothetical protein